MKVNPFAPVETMSRMRDTMQPLFASKYVPVEHRPHQMVGKGGRLAMLPRRVMASSKAWERETREGRKSRKKRRRRQRRSCEMRCLHLSSAHEAYARCVHHANTEPRGLGHPIRQSHSRCRSRASRRSRPGRGRPGQTRGRTGCACGRRPPGGHSRALLLVTFFMFSFASQSCGPGSISRRRARPYCL